MPSKKEKDLRSLGEFGWIRRIAKDAPSHPQLETGIGDDAAVLRSEAGKRWLVTTDTLVEDVHFRQATTNAEDLGWKALAVNLSDIAAMGGEPLAAFLSLSLPGGLSVAWLDSFYKGLYDCARTFNVAVAGGDTTRSPENLVLTVTVVGQAETSRILRRDGARPGDSLWICGDLGLSRAGLLALENGWRVPQTFLQAHRRPVPRITEGRRIARSKRSTAMLDVSDGLLGDLLHICTSSGVGALIEPARLSIPPELASFCRKHALDPVETILTGGEDYALLFTLRGAKPLAPWPKDLRPPVRIGFIVPEPGLHRLDPDGSVTPFGRIGFDHFG